MTFYLVANLGPGNKTFVPEDTVIGTFIMKNRLTLSLRDCSTEGTSGNTSYKDDTYVMTDFSSGFGTSTSEITETSSCQIILLTADDG